MIETCQTNLNCEIKPSNCEYAVRCTTCEDLANNKEVYVCGRNNCKEIMEDKEMEKSKMVETVQKLEEENRILREKLKTLRTSGGDSADCGLNFDSPLDFAKSIIEHKTHVEGWAIESDEFKTEIPDHERVTFGYDELIEIAEYLLIYCKHNKEDL